MSRACAGTHGNIRIAYVSHPTVGGVKCFTKAVSQKRCKNNADQIMPIAYVCASPKVHSPRDKWDFFKGGGNKRKKYIYTSPTTFIKKLSLPYDDLHPLVEANVIKQRRTAVVIHW